MSNTPTVLMGTPGPCLKLQYTPQFLGENAVSWVVPLGEATMNLALSQETKEPLKEFLNLLGDAAKDILSGIPKIGQGVKIAINIIKLLGIEVGLKYLYMKSWAGSKPSRTSLKLNFSIGNKKEWNSKKEVYEPMLEIMSCTAPAGNGFLIESPIPSTLSVFLNYGAAVLEGIIEVGQKIGNAVSDIFSGRAVNVSDTELINPSNSLLIQDKLWAFEFGYWDGREFKSYFTLNNCIVTESNIVFAKEVQKIDNDYYPISGSITLGITSQGIITKEDMQFESKHDISPEPISTQPISTQREEEVDGRTRASRNPPATSSGEAEVNGRARNF